MSDPDFSCFEIAHLGTCQKQLPHKGTILRVRNNFPIVARHSVSSAQNRLTRRSRVPQKKGSYSRLLIRQPDLSRGDTECRTEAVPECEAHRNHRDAEEPKIADWALVFEQVSGIADRFEGADAEVRSVSHAAETGEESGQVRELLGDLTNGQPDQQWKYASKDRPAPDDGQRVRIH